VACAIPGMTVLFPSHRHNIAAVLEAAVLDWLYPKIFFEHKLLYGLPCDAGEYSELEPSADDPGATLFPTLVLGCADPDITLLTYGYSLTSAEEVMARLRQEELAVEIIAPSLLSPFPTRTILPHLLKRGRILVIEETHTEYGIGAEIGALLAGSGFRGRFGRIGTPRVPIPAARTLESQVIPGTDNIMNAVLEMLFPPS
jgi:2-oxoisovalerate dehydrogenase E1 component